MSLVTRSYRSTTNFVTHVEETEACLATIRHFLENNDA